MSITWRPVRYIQLQSDPAQGSIPFLIQCFTFPQTKVSSTTGAASAATTGSRRPAATATPTATTAASPVQSSGMRCLGTQHPQSADVQSYARRYARPGQRRVGRGQGDQWRGRVDQVVRRVGRRALRRVVCDCLVVGRRHFARRIPETGS